MWIVNRFKIQVLIALVIAMDIIAIKSSANIYVGLLVFFVSILAIFILDFDLYLYARFFYPEKPASKDIINLINTKHLKDYFNITEDNQTHHLDLIMHTGLFQVVILLLTIYVVSINGNVLAQALLLSLNANLIYRQLVEYNKYSNLNRWFNFYDGKKNKYFYFWYFILVISILIYLLII